MRFLPSSGSFLLVGLLAGVGCTPEVDDRAASATDAIEEHSQVVSGLLARCTMTKGEGDAFFRQDSVECTAEASSALPVQYILDVKVSGPNLAARSAAIAAGTPAKVSFFAKDAYPLELTVQAIVKEPRPSTADVQQLAGSPVLVHKLTLSEPLAEAMTARLPFDYWPVAVRSSQNARMELAARTAPLTPWTTKEGASEGSLPLFEKPIRATEPATMWIAAPTGTNALDATFVIDGRTVTGTLAGPGAYVLGATGLVREGQAPPVGPSAPSEHASSFGDVAETFLACHLGESTLDGQRVYCSARDVEHVKMRLFAAAVVNADGRRASTPISAGATAEIGLCVAAPCTVEGELSIEAVGAHDLPGRGGTIAAPLARSTAAAPARVRLPFDVWSASIDLRSQRVITIRLATEIAAFGPEWKPFGGVASNGLPNASLKPADGPIHFFAAPLGATSLTGEMKSIHPGPPPAVVDAPAFTITRGGRYQVSDALAIEPAP